MVINFVHPILGASAGGGTVPREENGNGKYCRYLHLHAWRYRHVTCILYSYIQLSSTDDINIYRTCPLQTLCPCILGMIIRKGHSFRTLVRSTGSVTDLMWPTWKPRGKGYWSFCHRSAHGHMVASFNGFYDSFSLFFPFIWQFGQVISQFSEGLAQAFPLQ